GRQTALYVDSATRLLTQYEQIFTDPIVGDSVTGVRFEGYRDVQGIRVPGSREQFRGTSWTIRTNYRAVSFNAPVDPSRFEVPSGYQQISYQPPSTPSVTSVGDGVYFLSGLTPSGRFNVLFVEFADHVVVVNAPTPSAVGEEVIARVTAAVPGKPIRTLVLTHPAYDHIAGVRAFVARGITVVAGAETRRMVEDAVAARFTIEPDALARAPRPLSIEDAGRRRVFADGRQRLELIDIGPDETGRDVLIAYLPAARLVFQADLVNPNYAGALGVAQPAAIMLEQRLTALKLDVERIAGGHGGVVARADLQQAVRRARGVTSPGR
ncbi:MAG TPA: MBL fold metallo-hydrolase, partial [Vicinamibacterales bacterium]|nr:MBL fold metallo-hydrolase [Vicinamibacterales bacterium]